jgi:hypothetical protein
MIKGRSKDDLRFIATGGGSLHVDGNDFSREDLRFIATGLSTGAQLIVSNSGRFSREDLRFVATGSTDGATVLFQ